jgi:ABC-type Fe3+ transport system permease subunit
VSSLGYNRFMLGSFTLPIKFFATACSQSSFFGLPAWYKYLNTTVVTNANGSTSCNFSNFSFWPPGNLLLILLAVLDMLLIIGGVVAVVFVMIGGVQYITSQGEPENTKHARTTIINALVGLVITIVAASLINYLGYRLGS